MLKRRAGEVSRGAKGPSTCAAGRARAAGRRAGGAAPGGRPAGRSSASSAGCARRAARSRAGTPAPSPQHAPFTHTSPLDHRAAALQAPIVTRVLLKT